MSGKINCKLFQIRAKRGYVFKKQFAKELDIPYNQYNDYENGVKVPSLRTAIKIAQKLNMHVEDIWGYSS